MGLFAKGPPPLPSPPRKGARVRVGYHKRGPWWHGSVVESLGKVTKVAFDQGGVTYFVRMKAHWLDQELRQVIVAAPEHDPEPEREGAPSPKALPVANDAAFRFTERGGKVYNWSRAELDDTILEGAGWDSAAMRARIDRMKPGQKIRVAGETLERTGGGAKTSKRRKSLTRGLTKAQRAEAARAYNALARRRRP